MRRSAAKQSPPAWVTNALSAEQVEAVASEAPHLCLFASAGSGKTQTLTRLIGRDLAIGIDPLSLVAFTFTEKAADELRARVQGMVRTHLPEVTTEGMFVGTIHSWCFQYLLTKEDYFGFESLDELQVDALVTRLYDDLRLETAYDLPFPRGIPRFVADVEVFYNEGLDIADVPKAQRQALRDFFDILSENRLLTFGGMIRAATSELGRVPSKIARIYVDEYQDVNPAQVALIKSMSTSNCRVCAVGDDMQSIYQWRGSDVSRILRFADDFTGATTLRLTTNYRSLHAICEIGNAVSAVVRSTGTHVPAKSGRPHAVTTAVSWYSVDGREVQAEAVADLIHRFVDHGSRWQDIAVLLRSARGYGREFADALGRHNIPVHAPLLSRGGDFINGFLLPLLEWVEEQREDPRNRQEELALEERAEALAGAAAALSDSPLDSSIFWKSINSWRQQVIRMSNAAYDLRTCIYDVMEAGGIVATPSDANLIAGIGISSQIIRSIEEIHRRRLIDRKRRSPRGLLREAIHALIREQERFGETIPLDQPSDAVVISTVHQAKGLEWPVVIVPMLSTTRFPVRTSRHGTSYPDRIAERYGTQLNDERRLFYVACTRARDRLVLMDPDSGSSNRRSKFVRDVASVVAPKALTRPNSAFLTIPRLGYPGAPATPLRIGVTDLLMYLECPFQFALRRRSGIQPSVGDELGFGAGLHELVRRRLLSGHEWAKDDYVAAAELHVRLPLASPAIESQSREAIVRRLLVLEGLGAFAGKTDPEEPIEIALENGIVHGVIDALTHLPEGVVLRDWKSSLHKEFITRYERQLQLYTFALRKAGATVLRAEIVDLKASELARELVLHEVDTSENTIANFMSLTTRALASLAADDFPPHPSAVLCGHCDMRRLCPHRQ